jgi:hypothetical protein
MIYPLYRRQGDIIFIEYAIKEMDSQLKINHFDVGKGRQMPAYYAQ